MCGINTTAQMRTQRRMQTHVAGRTPRVAPGWRHLKTSVFSISDVLVSTCCCCFLRGSTNPAHPTPSTYPRHVHSRGRGACGVPHRYNCLHTHDTTSQNRPPSHAWSWSFVDQDQVWDGGRLSSWVRKKLYLWGTPYAPLPREWIWGTPYAPLPREWIWRG
jgi:hypothetical protein